MVAPAAGLYRCDKCGGFEPGGYDHRHYPVSIREKFANEDDTRTRPIDGRPVPIDRRIK